GPLHQPHLPHPASRACSRPPPLAAAFVASYANDHALLWPLAPSTTNPPVCFIARHWWGRPRGSGGLAHVRTRLSPVARGALGYRLAWATLTPASAPRTP